MRSEWLAGGGGVRLGVYARVFVCNRKNWGREEKAGRAHVCEGKAEVV